ncbi:hypothetical protein ACFV0H_16810 [Streptomyces erythrochromogenes]|uniref:hypothetical protein n=1 Tax=Streptomyces erythrochromogenes TaxID=285574 RepID=UPI0036BEBF78
MSEDVSRRSAMRLIAAAGTAGASLAAGGCAPTVPPPGAVPRGSAGGAPGAPAAGSGTGTGTGGAARIDALLERLTLEEKTALLHGAAAARTSSWPPWSTSSAPRTPAGTSRPSPRTRA